MPATASGAAAHDVIHDLKHLGLKDLAILTGDRAAPARAVAKKVHIKQVEAELTPAGKADWIEQTATRRPRRGHGRRRHQRRPGPGAGGRRAGLGRRRRRPGRRGRLGRPPGRPAPALPETIRLARQTVRVIRQNILFFAFGFNAVAVALAGLRVLGPVAAAIVHQIGSLLVLLNAIRLLGFERWHTFGIRRARRPGRRRPAGGAGPSVVLDRVWRSPAVDRSCAVVVAAALAYLGSGITLIEPGQVGVLRRFGRYRPPSARARPAPPLAGADRDRDRGRARSVATGPGRPAGPTAAAAVKPVGWNATHGVAARRVGPVFHRR